MHVRPLPFVLTAGLAWLAGSQAQRRSRSVEPVAGSGCWLVERSVGVGAEGADGQKSGRHSQRLRQINGICPIWAQLLEHGTYRRAQRHPSIFCIVLKAAQPAERTPSLSHTACKPCGNTRRRRISAARTDQLMMCWRMQVIVFGSRAFAESSTASACHQRSNTNARVLPSPSGVLSSKLPFDHHSGRASSPPAQDRALCSTDSTARQPIVVRTAPVSITTRLATNSLSLARQLIVQQQFPLASLASKASILFISVVAVDTLLCISPASPSMI
jgi:hypothetical protein